MYHRSAQHAEPNSILQLSSILKYLQASAGLLVLDWNFPSGSGLELTAQGVGDGLVLGLLGGGLVVLWALAENLLLEHVDALVKPGSEVSGRFPSEELRWYAHILVLLALWSTASSRVQLVADATEESTSGAGALLVGGVGGLLGGTLLVLGVSAGHVLNEIHCCAFELILVKWCYWFVMVL